MKKRILIIAAAMMTAVSLLSGCSLLPASPNEVVLKVDDSKLTADAANFYARYIQAQYETYYGAYVEGEMWKTEADKGKTYEESVKASIQDELKLMLVLEQHMKDMTSPFRMLKKKWFKRRQRNLTRIIPLKIKKSLCPARRRLSGCLP